MAGRVAVRDVYPGIDLVIYGGKSGPEYDWVLQPGANPAAIRFEVTISQFRDIVSAHERNG
jgi:hypothetical protein